jgi:murein L,D-transpeptidase YafK
MLAFKQERQLEVWAANRSGNYARIATYPILGASGSLGPKRAQGDLQVPEGLYRLTDLNPKSVAHLSFRVDYPNAEDRAHALVPPSRLGGDIFVHGHTVSYGCLAMGDPTIETLFCLVARVPAANRRILLCPVDFRQNPAYADTPREEAWIRDLYQRERKMLTNFPLSKTP